MRGDAIDQGSKQAQPPVLFPSKLFNCLPAVRGADDLTDHNNHNRHQLVKFVALSPQIHKLRKSS